ncbi:trehalose-phosphatase [Halobacteriales archaeon QS_4_69_34]|nr:MAG: trehalose-phosphatase [Halobacteriales archaeon QS_4_69_34]
MAREPASRPAASDGRSRPPPTTADRTARRAGGAAGATAGSATDDDSATDSDAVAETPLVSDGGRPPLLDDRFGEVAERTAATEGLLLGLDFDGTLAPIEADPDTPALSSAHRAALEALNDRPGVAVAVVSGRALADLRSRVAVEGVVYAGNHGLELSRNGRTAIHPIAAKRCRAVDRVCSALEERFAATRDAGGGADGSANGGVEDSVDAGNGNGEAGIGGVEIENKTLTATVHYRHAPERGSDVRRAVAEAVEHVAGDPLRVSEGKRIVEVGPAVPWDKGRTMGLLADDHPAWLPMYVGDDTTDETAFRVLSDEGGRHGNGRGIGIHVGPGADTAAAYRVADPAGVERLLEWLVESDVGEA